MILRGVVAVVRPDWLQIKPAISYPVDFGWWFRDITAADNCVGLCVGTLCTAIPPYVVMGL